MALILTQPPDYTHINKVGYTLYGNVQSDDTVTRRLGYQLFNVDTGEEITPMRSFDPLGQGGQHKISYQRNLRSELSVPHIVVLTTLTHLNYSAASVKVRLDSSIIEINNLTCDRTVTLEQTGREITVINGTLGADEEEYARIGETVSLLTNKFPLAENHYEKCGNERDFIYVYAREATTYTVNYQYITGTNPIELVTVSNDVNLDVGVNAIDLSPIRHVNSPVDYQGFHLVIGGTTIYVHDKECNCDDEHVPLYAWHPYGGFDNLNMEFIDSWQVERQNEIVRISDWQGSQTESRNLHRGFTSISHTNREQKIWTRRMPNTKENRQWAKYVMSAKLFVAQVTLQGSNTKQLRKVAVASSTYTVSKRNDEILMNVIGYFNQPIEVQ